MCIRVTLLDIHKRKFVKWGGVYNPSSVKLENCILNYSNYCLSNREKFLLSLGLNFCVPSFNFPKKDIILHFEYLLNKSSVHNIYGNITKSDVSILIIIVTIITRSTKRAQTSAKATGSMMLLNCLPFDVK